MFELGSDPFQRSTPTATATLAALRERARPVSTGRTQLLPVAPPLAGLLAIGGLQRGSTIGVDAGPGGGTVTLALALVATASAAGSWCVAVGLADLGTLAAAELGLVLDRLALVPRPGGDWPSAVGRLVEEVDLVLLRPPAAVAGARARQLAARLRRQRSVLVLVGAGRWPEPCDVRLQVDDARWVEVGRGEDRLRRRLATVTATARRGDARPRRARLWLPGADGTVTLANESPGSAGLLRRPPAPASDRGDCRLPDAGGRAGQPHRGPGGTAAEEDAPAAER